MGINIEIEQRHIQDLIDFYVEKQKAMKANIAMLESDVKAISATIMQLRQQSRTVNFLGDDAPAHAGTASYNAKWTWSRKITFAIKHNGKPATTREIVEILCQFEPELIADRKRAIASVSSTLSVKTSAGEEFVKEMGETGDYEYDTLYDDAEEPPKVVIQPIKYAGNIEPVDDLPF